MKFNSWLLPPLLLSLLQSVLSKLSESLFPPVPPPLGSPFILFLSAFCCAKDICCSGNIKCAVGGVSFVLFFLFFRLELGVVTTLALFFPNTFVNVVDVAEIPIVVVVVALGGSIGTSCSTEIIKRIKITLRATDLKTNCDRIDLMIHNTSVPFFTSEYQYSLVKKEYLL